MKAFLVPLWMYNVPVCNVYIPNNFFRLCTIIYQSLWYNVHTSYAHVLLPLVSINHTYSFVLASHWVTKTKHTQINSCFPYCHAHKTATCTMPRNSPKQILKQGRNPYLSYRRADFQRHTVTILKATQPFICQHSICTCMGLFIHRTETVMLACTVLQN